MEKIIEKKNKKILPKFNNFFGQKTYVYDRDKVGKKMEEMTRRN